MDSEISVHGIFLEWVFEFKQMGRMQGTIG